MQLIFVNATIFENIMQFSLHTRPVNIQKDSTTYTK